jgi:mRNA-degrading endonuclease RelE of RelBE toxin-antitoxin system
MSYQIVSTQPCEREARLLSGNYPSPGKDFELLISQMEKNACIGSVPRNHCYKIPMGVKSKGKGKGGGARVIIFVQPPASLIS